MVVYRADPLDLKEVDVDVTKKSGKDLGLGFAECKGYGIYITEIVRIEKTKKFFASHFPILFTDTRRNH